jgi:hypothetical protein
MRRIMLALLFGASVAGAQTGAIVKDAGPGAAGPILRAALARPHRLVQPDSTPFTQRRGEVQQSTLIVLGRTAYIGGKVEGDVIVVNADLFVRAGAEITGRAIAIGGGAYPSTLAYVGGGIQSHRDDAFTVTRVGDAYELTYRSLREGASDPLLFPGVYGLRIPSYDRVNGLSLPFGPALSFAGGRGEMNAIATYRSDLGKVDAALDAELQLTRRSRLEARAERGSFTNDAWIYPSLINSGATLVFGEDTRNWYRADRGELTLHRVWEMARTTVTPFIGGRIEDSWAVGPVAGTSDGPWSIFGKDDTLAMLRPNPQVGGDLLGSGLVGTALRFEAEDLRIRGRVSTEKGFGLGAYPDVFPSVTPDFLQVTTDLDVRFPTFGEQSYGMEVHWVTSGGTLPSQRFVYLGGPGTMPFLELLEQGGGELLLVDQRYSIPFPQYRFGFMGSPTLQLRHRLGSAGLKSLPTLEQMVGVGVSLTVIRGEVRLDPATGDVKLTAGFTFAR